ncbi:hypothetical protein ACFLWB_02510 [Chloroflexota bacterium]
MVQLLGKDHKDSEMLGGDSPMTATGNEMKDLMGEHEVIRAHMKFITKSFESVATKSDQVIAQSIQLNDLKMLYLWPLYDFREAIQRHIVLDERIFNTLSDSTSIEDTMIEHEEIRKLADNAIQLAENAVYNEFSQEELNQSALNIRETFKRICKLIEAHTTAEDRLLKLAQEDL